MASESTDEGGVTVELPPGLDKWLDERAAELGVPRDVVVRQLVASYQATAELDESTPLSELLDIESVVEETVGDQLDAAVAAAVEDTVASHLDETVQDRFPDITDAVEGRLDSRFDDIESDVDQKITDVRQRVVQLKREIDTKVPTDHQAFTALAELEDEVETLNHELVEVRDDMEDTAENRSARLDDVEERFDEVEARLSDTEDKLKRVAWVVNDLRDNQGGRDAHQKAVDRIKRAAAQEGISAASCQNCSESVEIGLLTDPNCPHCNSTVSDVRPDGGIIRKRATLVTASQLEAGDTDE